MGRLSVEDYLQKGILCCPICHRSDLRMGILNQQIECALCNINFDICDGIPNMLPPQTKNNPTKKQSLEFWGELYRNVYMDMDREMDAESFFDNLELLEDMFSKRDHIAIKEMEPGELSGKEVLEIGCGAGSHSALFVKYGAKMTSLDLSFDRAKSTAKKLDFFGDSHGNFVLQGDAEYLTFVDDSFDIVYSNGVLHHTPDTERAVGEVYRVLKKGGKAVIMLYAKHSVNYWLNLFLYQGIIKREYFRSPNWLGHITERMGPKGFDSTNPVTKVYSTREIRRIFDCFKWVKIRKHGFRFSALPYIGPLLSRLVRRKDLIHKGGDIAYGMPIQIESQIEKSLGRIFGFCLAITATK